MCHGEWPWHTLLHPLLPSYTSVCHVYIYWTYVTFRKNLLEIKFWATVLYLVSNITSKLVNFHTRMSFRYHICLPGQVGEPFFTSQWSRFLWWPNVSLTDFLTSSCVSLCILSRNNVYEKGVHYVWNVGMYLYFTVFYGNLGATTMSWHCPQTMCISLLSSALACFCVLSSLC